jgi:hypothetical protein
LVCSCSTRWGETRSSAAEDERAGGVDEEVDRCGAGAGVGAVGAERLAEGADDDVDLAAEAGRRDRSAPAGSDGARRVGLVDHQPAAVAPGQLLQAGDGGEVAVHREDAVADDQRPAPSRPLQAPGEVLEVTMAIDEGLGPCQAASVDDAGVVELVREDDLLAPGEGGDDAGVGEIAGAEQQRSLAALELGQLRLELAMRLHVAGDKPRGAGPGAPAHRRLGRRGPHLRVIGEAEVVVGAEQQHRLPAEQHPRALRTVDQAQAPVDSALAQLLQPRGDVGHAAARG